MILTDLHASLLSLAFERLLGAGSAGSVAFVRCLTSDVVEALAESSAFAPEGWQVWRVADANSEQSRTPGFPISTRNARILTLHCSWCR